MPEFLKGSYARYKDDTDRFATWLLKAAEKCGHRSELPVADGSAKNNKASRKSSSAAPRYRATIAELRIFGGVVAKSTVTIPESVLAVARRAITLRKDAALWFLGKGDHDSNKRHAHFVEALEEICTSLEWKTRRPSSKQGAGKSPSVPAGRVKDVDADGQAWLNKFAALTVEEPEEMTDSAAEPKQIAKVEVVEEEADVQDHLSHALFRIFCVFRDLHNMREFISQTWVEYRDNKLDLMTASVVTDSALQLARDLIQELVDSFPADMAIGGDELALQRMIYHAACLARGMTEPASEELGLTFNVKMADVADWCYLPTSTLLQSFVPIMQATDIPVSKKGFFGVYDPKADRSFMSIGDRFNEDKIILLETLPEFCLIEAYKIKLPGCDEITTGFVEFTKTRKPTLWLGFAAQILLDAHHIMRSSRVGACGDLRMSGLRISKIIKDFKDLSNTHPKPAFWPKEGDVEIDRIQTCVDIVINNDPLQIAWACTDKIQKHDDHFLFTRNPVLCGTLMFHLNLRMQMAGQALLNQWYDVQQLAFLYNLVQKVPDQTLVWPDLEAFIKIHGENRIFVGNRPKNAAESLNRLETATGISSVSRFGRDARNTGSWHQPDGKARLLEPTTRVANLFRARYIGEDERRSIAYSDIDKLLDELTKDPTTAKKGAKRRGGKRGSPLPNAQEILSLKWSKQHTIAPLQFLALVKSKMFEEEPVLMFNYFGMHRRTHEMLRLIRNKEHHKFVQYFTAGYMPDETLISGLVIFIHHVARGSALASQQMGLIPAGGMGASRIVVSCGEVMRNYLRTKGDVACKELRTFCKNKTPLQDNAGVQEDEAEKKFMYAFGLEEVLDPKAMASLMTGIPVA